MTSNVLPYFLAFFSFFAITEDKENTTCVNTKPLLAPEMVLVKGGTFQMGSDQGYDHELPIHEVTLSDFYIGRYEVTVGEYLDFAKSVKKHYPEWLDLSSRYNIETGFDDQYGRLGEALTNPNHPIMGVSWYDAVAYCIWLSERDGVQYRLPTEAEWEYAARGGQESQGYVYAGSNDYEEVAWTKPLFDGKTHPVGQKKANELGLYDMSGNVCEWCSDYYGDYPSESQTNPTGPSTGDGMVFRGGGFTASPDRSRVYHRNDNPKMARLKGIGFRLVHD